MADLKLGSKGKDVEAVQKALVALGIKPTVKTNGVFDKTTDAAVRAYQKKNGLKADGVVGSKTRGKLQKTANGRAKQVVYDAPDFAKLIKVEAKRFEKARRSGADVIAEIKRNPNPEVKKISKYYLSYYRNLHTDYGNWTKSAAVIAKLQKEHKDAIRNDPWTAEELVKRIKKYHGSAAMDMRYMESAYEGMADYNKELKQKYHVDIAA